MGGYGSGRHGSKQKAEQCRSLEANKLHRHGCLSPGWSGNWTWSIDGQEVSRIALKASAHRIVLDYVVSIGGGEGEPITESVPLVHVPCNYGGERPYFRCPGIVNGRPCNRRVGKLFSGGRYFLCRHCYDIAYSSQSEARYDRMLRKANKRRMALGGEPGTANWIAPKPKGMWHRTYERHRFEIDWCEEQANRHFIAKYQHLLSPKDLADYLAE